MATVTTNFGLFQPGQTITFYPWDGDFYATRSGEKRESSITTVAAAANGSASVTNAGLLANTRGGYLAEGQRWPAGGGLRQVQVHASP